MTSNRTSSEERVVRVLKQASYGATNMQEKYYLNRKKGKISS